MKILWQDVGGNSGEFAETYQRGLKEVFNGYARPDAEVVIRGVNGPIGPSSHAALRILNNAKILRGLVSVEREDFDAVIMGCVLDPLLIEAREMLNIPVVGGAEASFYVALMLCERFGVVTVDEKHSPPILANIIRYGIAQRTIPDAPVRTMGMTREEFFSIFQDVRGAIGRFMEVAQDLVASGADLVLPGCMIVSMLLCQEGINRVKGTNVPILDMITPSIKIAEVLGELCSSPLPLLPSRRLLYRPLTETDRQTVINSKI